MFREEGEVEGKERPEGAVAGDTEGGSGSDEGKADEEGICGANEGGGRGRGGAEDGRESGGEGRSREVLGEDEEDVGDRT